MVKRSRVRIQPQGTWRFICCKTARFEVTRNKLKIVTFYEQTNFSFAQPIEALTPPPPIPDKSLCFKKRQFELLLSGNLRPRDRIDLKEVSNMLNRVEIEYRAAKCRKISAARNLDQIGHYDVPRDLIAPAFVDPDLDVQLRRRCLSDL